MFMEKIWTLFSRGKAGLFRLIPEKTARNLFNILVYYAATLYAVMLLCHAVFRGGFTGRAVLGLASLAAVAAVAAGLGFWMEGRLFFPIYSAGLALGALYMLYVLIFNAAPSWGDMASLFGFLVISLIGLGAGVSAEFVKYLLKARLEKDG